MHSVTPATTKQRRHHRSCVHHVHCNPQYFRNRSDLSICNNFVQTRRMSPSAVYGYCVRVWMRVFMCLFLFLWLETMHVCPLAITHLVCRFDLRVVCARVVSSGILRPFLWQAKDSEADHEIWRGRAIVKSYLNSSEGHFRFQQAIPWQQLNWPLPESVF